jgi:hypothetical protein
VPAQHGELARGRHDGDLHPAPCAHALIERPQRAGGLDRDPGGLDEHPAGVRATLLGDPAMGGGLIAGLLTRGFKPTYRTSLFGELNREKSPTAAVIDMATATSTPGIVINRLVS